MNGIERKRDVFYTQMSIRGKWDRSGRRKKGNKREINKDDRGGTIAGRIGAQAIFFFSIEPFGYVRDFRAYYSNEDASGNRRY